MSPPPVSPAEVARAVKLLLAEKFSGRHLDMQTVQLGLSSAAHDMILLSLKEVAK